MKGSSSAQKSATPEPKTGVRSRPKAKAKSGPGPKATGAPKTNRGTGVRTGLWNAERFVNHHPDEMRFVERWMCWVIWDGRKWQRDPSRVRVKQLAMDTARLLLQEAFGMPESSAAERDAKKAAIGWALKSQSSGGIASMIDLAAPLCVIEHDKLDANPWLLNCPNGTVNLKTGTLFPHRREDLLTKMTASSYNPEAGKDLWESTIHKSMPDDGVRDFFHRFTGYCLTADVGERMFVMLYGKGRNGKSLILRVIQDVMGDYATTAAPGLLMAKQGEGHPTEVADLFSIRLAVSSEVKKGRTFDEELVKRVTGNDLLKARRMREDFWEFPPTHKIILACNHKPRVKDATDSFWDRLAVIHYGVRIGDKEVDPKLAVKLRKQHEGVLAWLVRGCLEYQRRGLKRPEEVQKATKEYRDEEDRLGQFIAEQCVFDPASFTLTSALMGRAQDWSRSRGFYPPTSKDLAAWFEDHPDQGAAAHHTNKGNGWKGIKIRLSEAPAVPVKGVKEVKGVSG